MDSLIIPATEGDFITPEIRFDTNNGVFEISGESFIENTDEFYDPVTDWLDEFLTTSTQNIIFNFKFTYYNSSSSKSILKIMKSLKTYTEKASVEVNWYYPSINEDLRQEGLDYQMMAEIPINIYEFEL
jgi:SiaC family regulatory phosphoprotein